MKKGKAFKTLAVFSVCLCTPFILAGCKNDSESKVGFRVQEGYIQVTEDGTNWKNLIDVDELKGEQGQPGQNGVGLDGREVEFQSTETHIQWRYKTNDNSDTWKDLVAFEELEQKEPVVDVEAINQRGFELFKSKLNDMNSNYKVTYDYADKYIVESFGNYGFAETIDGYTLIIRASMEYEYSAKIRPNGSDSWSSAYAFNGVAQITEGWVPSNHLIHMYEYQQDIEEYNYICSGGGVNYLPNSADENFNFNYVKYLKSFTAEDIVECKFNDIGDCVISFDYYGGNDYSLARPYLKSDYTYEFNVTKDGQIVKCYIYEKDFLNEELKGDLYCKISYEKGESLITSDMLEELLEKAKEENPEITSWVDYFAFTKSE